MKKLIFLDIDGTLTGYNGVLTEKTKEALRRAKAAGHTLMLCTGRTKCQIEEKLLEEGFFDGMVAAAGAYVEYHGQTLHEQTLEPEALEKLVADLHREKIPMILMSKDHLYATKEDEEIIQTFYEAQLAALSSEEEKGGMGEILPLEENRRLPLVEKIVFEEAPCMYEGVKKLLNEDFDIVQSSFHEAESRGGEISAAGVTKASGIELILDYLGVNKEDIVAFGDSYNDLEMLAFAAVGVAMGNAPEDVKKAADMVTDHVDKEGLYKGFETLGLI